MSLPMNGLTGALLKQMREVMEEDFRKSEPQDDGKELFAELLAKPSQLNLDRLPSPRIRRFVLCLCGSQYCAGSHWEDE